MFVYLINKKMKSKKQQHPMPHRTPADMHCDGVYFSEQLLAQIEHRKHQLKQLEDKKEN
jgi:hypothetical protein